MRLPCVEPAEPQGGVGRFDPHGLVAIIYPGCRGRNAPRSPAALPRAICCQAFSLKSRVLMDERYENIDTVRDLDESFSSVPKPVKVFRINLPET